MANLTGTIQRNYTEQLKGTLSQSNLNMVGTLDASRTYPAVPTQEKTVTSSLVRQIVLPDGDKKLSKVTVEPLPITRVINDKGGYTINIGV